MQKEVFKGFKVELESVYNQLSIEEKLNYMWFIRKDENSKVGKIYLGSRPYSGEITNEDVKVLLEKINNLDIKIDAVNIKVDAEGTRIVVLNDKIEIVDTKIDVVKEQCAVIYQKIDDIYDDSNKIREDVEEMKVIVADTLEKVDNVDIKIEAEIVRAKEAENKNASDIATVNTNLVDAVNNINKNMYDGFNTINGGIATEISERKEADKALEDGKVSWMAADDKRIVLDNHKNLLGKSTEGNTYNLAMVSKWDVVDLGTTHLPLTINSSEVPKVQLIGQTGEQAKHVGFAEDIASEVVRATQAEFNLDGKIETEVLERKEDVANLQTVIDKETTERKEDVVAVNTVIAQVNENLVDAVNNINKNMSDGFNTINGGIENEIKPSIDKLKLEKVSYTKATKDGKEYDTIVLKNHANLLGENNTGNGTYNLAMVSKWNVADYGSASLPINLNGINERPTYNDKNDIALLSDVNNVTVKENDKVLSMDEAYKLSATLNLTLVEGVLSLLGNNNEEIATVNLPADKFLKFVSYDEDTKELIFVFITDSGEVTEKVNIASLIDVYTAGNGLTLTANEFSVKLDGDTQVYLEVSEAGLKIVGVDEAFNAVDTKVNDEVVRATNKENELVSDITSLKEEKVSYTKVDDTRKAITLENNDLIVGKNVAGNGTFNLAMVSKWDVADYGSTSLHSNINSKDRPTIQLPGMTGENAEGIAYKSEVDNAIADNIVYTDAEVAKVSVEVKEYADNGITNLSDELKIYADGKVSEESDRAIEVETKLRTDVDYESTRALEAEANINKELDRRVVWDESNTKIVLPSGGQLVGTKFGDDPTIGATIAQLNQWDVMDFGSPQYKLNLNVPVNSRPTVQEAGQTGAEANEIAYVDDVNQIGYGLEKEKNDRILAYAQLEDKINLLTGKVDYLNIVSKTLETKVQALSKTNIEAETINGTTVTVFDDKTKDYVLDGTVSESLTISGKSVELKDMTVSNNARLSVNTGDLEIINTNVSGAFPKANGNAVIKATDAEYVVIKDMTFDSSDVYNGIEIGLSGTVLPKSVIFDNCKFLGKFTNNAILIFGTQNNATITLNNCYFEEVSNALRISNKENVNCEVNVINCTVGKWETRYPYQGFLICEDYTSANADEANANNLFGNGKIKLNFTNLIGPDSVKIKPENVADVCGTGDDKQVVYVYQDKPSPGTLVAYSEEFYPTVTFE